MSTTFEAITPHIQTFAAEIGAQAQERLPHLYRVVEHHEGWPCINFELGPEHPQISLFGDAEQAGEPLERVTKEVTTVEAGAHIPVSACDYKRLAHLVVTTHSVNRIVGSNDEYSTGERTITQELLRGYAGKLSIVTTDLTVGFALDPTGRVVRSSTKQAEQIEPVNLDEYRLYLDAMRSTAIGQIALVSSRLHT